MKVKKGKVTYDLKDPVHIAAFKRAGWEEVKGKDAKRGGGRSPNSSGGAANRGANGDPNANA